MLFRQHQQAKQWHDYGPTLAAEELGSKIVEIAANGGKGLTTGDTQ